MKSVKMSLANVQGKLNRAQMKNIMAGEGLDCLNEWDRCSTANGDKCCEGLVCASGLCQIATEEVDAP